MNDEERNGDSGHTRDPAVRVAALTRGEFFAAGPIHQLELVCERVEQLSELVMERETEMERHPMASPVGLATLESFAGTSETLETASQEMRSALSRCYAAWKEQEAQQQKRRPKRNPTPSTWEIVLVCRDCNGEGTVEHQVEADVFRTRDCEHCDRGEVTVTEMAYEDEAEVRADYPNAISISIRRAV
jgi:hypothetical protein